MQDPIGHSVWASKKPYSAVLRMRAGLSSWAADLLLVGLEYLYVFSSSFKRLQQKQSNRPWIAE